jgi:U3 small nucleolar RNA-associated protein 18
MASFSGDKVICTGKRPYFYTYSLETGVVDRIGHIRGREEINLSQHYISPDNKYILLIGKDGAINMLDQKNMQWIATLKMNSQCCDLTFSKDGRFVYSFGRDGDVYQWDMESRTCMDKFFDQGAVKPKSISASPDDSYLATGYVISSFNR